MNSSAASREELETATVAARSFGGQGVMLPFDWYDGKETKEPCDILWANRDCVLLIYHKAVQPNKDEQRVLRRNAEAVERNFAQAKGALRIWRNTGQAMRGTAHGQLVELRPEGRRIIVASVVDGPVTPFEARRDKMKELNVDLAVTMPHSFLLAMANSPLPIIDLCARLMGLCRADAHMSAGEAVDWLNNYVQECWATACRAHALALDDPDVAMALEVALGIRTATNKSLHDPGAVVASQSYSDGAFTDISLTGVMGLAANLAKMRKSISEQFSLPALAIYPRQVCLLIVGHTHLWTTNGSMAQLLEHWWSEEVDADIPPRLTLIWDQSTGGAWCIVPPDRGESLLHRLLATFAVSGDIDVSLLDLPSEAEQVRIARVFQERVFDKVNPERRLSLEVSDPHGFFREDGPRNDG